jgi:hypothetical protein
MNNSSDTPAERTSPNDEVLAYYDALQGYSRKQLMQITTTETNEDQVAAAWLRIEELNQRA